MTRKPAFYLVSADSLPLLLPRRCYVEERLTAETRWPRDDYLRVVIEPPIIGQPYGLGDRDIEDVFLATRYVGATLHPIGEWPMVVFVCRIVNAEIRYSGRASGRDIDVMLIGELYPTQDEAIAALKRLDAHHYPVM